jgi:hypothetical protein
MRYPECPDNPVDGSGTTRQLSTEIWKRQSCSCWRDSNEARVHTASEAQQVRASAGEKVLVHRNVPPLSTTTNLN